MLVDFSENPNHLGPEGPMTGIGAFTSQSSFLVQDLAHFQTASHYLLPMLGFRPMHERQ